MRRQLFVLPFLFFMAASHGALPQEPSGREQSEIILLLSQSDFDMRLAAKSIYHQGSGHQLILDLLAEVTWSGCSGSRKLGSDTLSWLAKALGNTTQARYAGLLDYCLSRVTDKKTLKYITLARDTIVGETDNSFEGGMVDRAQMRARLTNKGSAPPGIQTEKLFAGLRKGRPLEDVYAAVGVPDSIRRASVPVGKAGHLYVKVRKYEDMIEFVYGGLGTARFGYNVSKAKWLLAEATSDNGLFWTKRGGYFVIQNNLIATGGAEDLLEFAYYLLEQISVETAVLDRVADRIYRSRMTKDDELIDALSWLCKAIMKSENGRYKQILFDVSNTAESGKLRGYAKAAAKDLPETASEKYVP